MTKLQYRGVSYDNATHEAPSTQPVDHAYRGQHYDAPLRHEPADVDVETEFHYRGNVYHHRAEEAAQQVNQG
jgi:hypothetical protein